MQNGQLSTSKSVSNVETILHTLKRLRGYNECLFQSSVKRLRAFQKLAKHTFKTREIVEELGLMQSHILNSIKAQCLHVNSNQVHIVNTVAGRIRSVLALALLLTSTESFNSPVK